MDIERKKAEELVAEASISLLSDREVSDILSEYWMHESEQEIGCAIENGDLPQLEEDVISYMTTNSLPEIPDRELLKPLIMDRKVHVLR